MSTFWPDSKDIENPDQRRVEIVRLIAKMPTVAAGAYRRNVGLPYVFPDPELDYTSNFLAMMFKTGDVPYAIDPVLRDAMDLLFILHADHEQNCSTTTARVVGSAHADPYVTVSAAASALYGPRHGGANEAVLRMLEEIGEYENVPAFIDGVKSGDQKLMGFGHRVYKNYDPRAKILKETAHRVFEVTGKNPLLDMALKREEVALADNYPLLRILGEGGFGTVYLGQQLAEGRVLREVAIKVIRSGTSTGVEEATARFRREAEAIARLNHPNIVQLYDFGVAGESTFYMVLERVQGQMAAQDDAAREAQ